MSARLIELSAVELGRAYAAGEVSPVKVVEAALGRIEAWEPAINAMYLLDREGALAQARASEERWRRGEALGPLDGAPITIKDNIALAGTPSPMGTGAFADAPAATADSPPAARVREAGCVILGKTTMPDLGMMVSGVSSLHGVTRNPWNTRRNTGGSSSGAGAGLAALYSPLALGTDIGGSVRLPAAYCGVFAHKPSLGRVPIHPPYWGRTTGPMTRTVADAALLMGVLSREDVRDYMSLPYQAVDYAGRLERPVRGLRLGLMLDVGVGTKATEEVKTAVEAAVRVLEGEGASVEPVGPFCDEAMLEGLNRFFQARAMTDFLTLEPERQARALPFIREWMRPALSWSAVELFRAFNKIPRMREAAVKACQPYDYVLSPTSPIPAYAAEEPCPGSDPAHPFDHICFTAPFNQSEQPAASICCGFTDDGLPIGLQIIGRRFDDLGVLQLAAAYERLRPAMPGWPEPPV
jgi:Asp-tRNA(Asn)/Glu-tRNA(Gln) amidotransferase A subunit family amidase